MPNSYKCLRASLKKRLSVFRARILGLNQAEFAHLLDISQAQISKWESPKSINPKSMDNPRERVTEFVEFILSEPPHEALRELYQKVTPRGEIIPGKCPERFSPLHAEMDQLRELVDLVFEETEQAEERWENVTRDSLCLNSEAPWRKSKIIAPSEFGEFAHEEMEHDLQVHGTSFVALASQMVREEHQKSFDSVDKQICRHFEAAILAELGVQGDTSRFSPIDLLSKVFEVCQGENVEKLLTVANLVRDCDRNRDAARQRLGAQAQYLEAHNDFFWSSNAKKA